MGPALGQRDARKEKVIWESVETKILDEDQTCAMTDGDQVNVGLLPSVQLGVSRTNHVRLETHLSAGLYTFKQPGETGPGGEGEPTSGGGQGGGGETKT
jgi:hypothetical protein